jgi:hypothetical protein
MDLGPRVGGLRQVVSEPGSSSLLFVEERTGDHFTTMPPRRRDRPMPMPNPAREREMCELHARLDAMETA